jgi:hypothetical protein
MPRKYAVTVQRDRLVGERLVIIVEADDPEQAETIAAQNMNEEDENWEDAQLEPEFTHYEYSVEEADPC